MRGKASRDCEGNRFYPSTIRLRRTVPLPEQARGGTFVMWPRPSSGRSLVLFPRKLVPQTGQCAERSCIFFAYHALLLEERIGIRATRIGIEREQ